MAWPTRFSSTRPARSAASRSNRHRPGRLLLSAALVLVPAGCEGVKRASRENDRLRAEVLDLKEQVQLLGDRNAELEAELRRPGPDLAALPPEWRANAPHVASISIGPLSHARDTDGDGRPDTLILYVRPADGRGRFVQMTGRLSGHAALLPAEGDAVTLGRVTLGPERLRDAYRSSVMGTHYTIDVPLELPDPVAGADPAECIAKVEFTDGLTGRSVTAQREINLSDQRSAIGDQ